MWLLASCGPRNCCISSKSRSAGTLARSGSDGRANRQEIVHDPFQPQNFPLHEFDVGVFRGGGLKFFLLDEQGGFDGGERVADFMGDAGGEHAEGGQFFMALDQRLAFPQFDLQRGDQMPVNAEREPRAEDEQQPEEDEDREPELGQRAVGVCSRLLRDA